MWNELERIKCRIRHESEFRMRYKCQTQHKFHPNHTLNTFFKRTFIYSNSNGNRTDTNQKNTQPTNKKYEIQNRGPISTHFNNGSTKEQNERMENEPVARSWIFSFLPLLFVPLLRLLLDPGATRRCLPHAGSSTLRSDRSSCLTTGLCCCLPFSLKLRVS